MIRPEDSYDDMSRSISTRTISPCARRGRYAPTPGAPAQCAAQAPPAGLERRRRYGSTSARTRAAESVARSAANPLLRPGSARAHHAAASRSAGAEGRVWRATCTGLRAPRRPPTCRPKDIVAARYALCTVLDEAAAQTPWGGSGVWAQATACSSRSTTKRGAARSSSSCSRSSRRTRGEPRSARAHVRVPRARLRRPLSRRRQRPGAARGAARAPCRDHAQAARRVSSAICRRIGRASQRHGATPRLAPPAAVGRSALRGAAARRRIYSGSRSLCNRAPTRRSRRHPGDQASAPAAPPRAAPPAPPRLAQIPRSTRSRAAWSRCATTPTRSIVTIRGDGLFEPGQRVDHRRAYVPLLARIADALERVPGNVLVTGHTDNQPHPPLRFPSNWHLSQERADIRDAAARASRSAPATACAPKAAPTAEPVAPNDDAARIARATAASRSRSCCRRRDRRRTRSMSRSKQTTEDVKLLFNR